MPTSIQRSVEEIRLIFPAVRESEIIFDLDRAQKDFCRETRILETVSTTLTLPGKCIFNLPATFNSLYRIDFFDTSNKPLYMQDLAIRYTIGEGKISFFSVDGTDMTSMPSNIGYVYLVFNARPSALTIITSTWSVDDEYIEGVVATVYKQYFAKYPTKTVTPQGVVESLNFTAVGYYKEEARKAEAKAKKYRTLKDTSPVKVINYQTGGAYTMPKPVNQTP